MANKEAVPVLLKDNRQGRDTPFFHERYFVRIFHTGCCQYLYFARRCTRVEERKGGEFPLALSLRDSLDSSEVERSLNFRGRQMAVTNNLFELSPLPELSLSSANARKPM